MEQPFELEDIEAVIVIIKAKGKHWSIMPKPGRKEEGNNLRVALAVVLLESHKIVIPSLEEIRKQNKKQPSK